MKKIAKGIYPTMVTPFRDGQIDECAVKQLVEYYITSGCQGVFAVCQSSEMSHLSLNERANLAKSVVDAVDGRISVVASGHVSDGIAAQAEEIKAVWDAGVDVVTLVTNRLAVYLSDNCMSWTKHATIIDMTALPPEFNAAQYPSFVVDGNTLYIAARVAACGAKNYHDSNCICFCKYRLDV